MARKKTSPRAGDLGNSRASCCCVSELDALEASSCASSATACSALNEQEEIVEDQFESLLDSLFEKRGSTRERAFEKLAVLLRIAVRSEDCSIHNDTIVARCLNSLRKGSAVESSLAAQVLGLHILTLAEANEGLFRSLQQDLERTSMNGGASAHGPEVQAAAVDTLALAAFVLVEDERLTQALMRQLQTIWLRGAGKPRAAALRGWSLLLSTLHSSMQHSIAADSLQRLAQLMHDRDKDVRVAAGEAAALVCMASGESADELLGLQGLDEGEEEEASAGGSSSSSGHGSPDAAASHDEQEEEEGDEGGGSDPGSAGERRSRGGAASGSRGSSQAVEGVMGRMRDIASNKGDALRRKRRDRASLRGTFRGLLAALEGAEPSCRIKLQYGDVIVVDGLAANARLAFLRRFLAGGFQAHMQHNRLLHDIFGFRPRVTRAEKLTAQEKRDTRSPSSFFSKARTASMKQNRQAKSSWLHGDS